VRSQATDVPRPDPLKKGCSTIPPMSQFGGGSVIQGYFLPGPSPRSAAQARLTTPVQHLGTQSAVQVPVDLSRFGNLPGQPLPELVQRKMEALFSTSFHDVRVHVGPQPAALGALAFTHGSQLYFAPGQYQPMMPHGQRLLGHELTHVVQQRTGRVRNPFGGGVALVQDRVLEAEADRMGIKAATFAPPFPVQAKLRPGVGAKSSALQMQPSLGDLATVSTTAVTHSNGGFQFQAISIGTAVVLTENSSRATNNFCTTAADWDAPTFTLNIPAEIRTTTGATRGRDIKKAADPKSAADKVLAGGVIVLAGGANGLHAEQSLLLVLADLMSRGNVVRNVVVAGNSLPCASCLNVLRSFSKWYKLLGYGTLSFNDQAGQGRGVAELGRGDFPASADKRFNTFIDRYVDQKAGAYTGSNGVVTHLG
jgi:hypothetical protein